MIVPHAKVIITKRIPEEDVLPGDVGSVVEEYRDVHGKVIGYELEMFSADGQTLATCTVPADAVREATSADRLCSRTLEPSAKNPKDRSDPVIDEIRAVRHRISEEFGHDPKKLVEHYMKLQERHPDRLVRPTDRPPEKDS